MLILTSLDKESKMKLRNILGLLLAAAALSACGGGKDKVTDAADGAMPPSAAESVPPAAEIMPPSAVPEASDPDASPEGALDGAADKAGEMLKEGAEDALDAVKDKAKEVITN